MISKTITYEDFDGNTQTTTAWFHMSKKKLIDYETSTDGGMARKLTALVESNNGGLLIRTFGEIVGMAYGERVDGDASTFRQSEEITEKFVNSPAYDALLMEVLTNENAATELVNGIFPKDLLAQVTAADKTQQPSLGEVTPPAMTFERAKELSGLQSPFTEGTAGTLLPWAFRDPTEKEQRTMTRAQLGDCMHRRTSGWEPKPL